MTDVKHTFETSSGTYLWGKIDHIKNPRKVMSTYGNTCVTAVTSSGTEVVLEKFSDEVEALEMGYPKWQQKFEAYAAMMAKLNAHPSAQEIVAAYEAKKRLDGLIKETGPLFTT